MTDSTTTADTIPVTILTGFLGSGKTTLLNHLVQQPDLSETAVLINEFGEIGLDHMLVREVKDDIVLLNSGCLCCTVRGDLVTALRDLFLKRVRGEVEFNRLVIETTGLADPAPILHTMMTDPLIGARYRLDGIVTTLDALHGADQLDRHRESVKQVAVADRIVMTKTDLADAEALQALHGRLAELNPSAPRLVAENGVLAPADILNAGLFKPGSKIPDVEGWLKAEAYTEHDHEHGHGHDDHHHHHHHDVNRHGDGIDAFCLTLDEPVEWLHLAEALEMIIASKGENLLRLKGILAVKGQEEPVAVHGVQHVFHPPATLPAWPEGHDRKSRLVFITREMRREAVEKVVRAALDQMPDIYS
ncbi:Putative metal chaperone [Caenispirillum salinarum AK4]|uniref:Putative metal chaperone n=1 Tax=Caenispirillum salinarum AK4 TaxID=1238182 RepID=K9HIK0_9PROT|nr:GTP-binding protein [Caenispirillum salinarum]EKV28446.1 Putative metal chaperone [Caenispirillum salinarum AK4]